MTTSFDEMRTLDSLISIRAQTTFSHYFFRPSSLKGMIFINAPMLIDLFPRRPIDQKAFSTSHITHHLIKTDNRGYAVDLPLRWPIFHRILYTAGSKVFIEINFKDSSFRKCIWR